MQARSARWEQTHVLGATSHPVEYLTQKLIDQVGWNDVHFLSSQVGNRERQSAGLTRLISLTGWDRPHLVCKRSCPELVPWFSGPCHKELTGNKHRLTPKLTGHSSAPTTRFWSTLLMMAGRGRIQHHAARPQSIR